MCVYTYISSSLWIFCSIVLTRLSNKMLNRHANFRRKVCSLKPLRNILVIGVLEAECFFFLFDCFDKVRKFPLILSLLSVSIMNEYWLLSNVISKSIDIYEFSSLASYCGELHWFFFFFNAETASFPQHTFHLVYNFFLHFLIHFQILRILLFSIYENFWMIAIFLCNVFIWVSLW